MYAIGDWAAVNNGQPYVDANGCWWQVTREEGWSTPPDPRVEVVNKPTADGQTSGQLLIGPRPIIIGGKVRAPDQQRLQAAMDTVSGLLTGQVREDTLTVAEAHLRRHATVRRDQATPVAKVSPFEATWALQLIADDPRRYGDLITVSTQLPQSSGGLTFPITFPITFAATVVTGQIGISNPGNSEAPIRMRVDGPCTGPIISHIAQGKQLVFASSYVIAAGNWLDITMGAGRELSVLENGQASRNGYVTSRGAFGLDPGDNTIGFNAAVYNAASLLTVYATPAWT
jgi:hypothetical protein